MHVSLPMLSGGHLWGAICGGHLWGHLWGPFVEAICGGYTSWVGGYAIARMLTLSGDLGLAMAPPHSASRCKAKPRQLAKAPKAANTQKEGCVTH